MASVDDSLFGTWGQLIFTHDSKLPVLISKDLVRLGRKEGKKLLRKATQTSLKNYDLSWTERRHKVNLHVHDHVSISLICQSTNNSNAIIVVTPSSWLLVRKSGGLVVQTSFHLSIVELFCQMNLNLSAQNCQSLCPAVGMSWSWQEPYCTAETRFGKVCVLTSLLSLTALGRN